MTTSFAFIHCTQMPTTEVTVQYSSLLQSALQTSAQKPQDPYSKF